MKVQLYSESTLLDTIVVKWVYTSGCPPFCTPCFCFPGFFIVRKSSETKAFRSRMADVLGRGSFKGLGWQRITVEGDPDFLPFKSEHPTICIDFFEYPSRCKDIERVFSIFHCSFFVEHCQRCWGRLSCLSIHRFWFLGDVQNAHDLGKNHKRLPSPTITFQLGRYSIQICLEHLS